MGAAPMGYGEEDHRMDGDGSVNTVLGEGEEREAPGKLPRESCDPEVDDRHSNQDIKEAAFGKAGSENHCHCHHVVFLIGSYPRLGRDALTQRFDKLDDTTSGIFEDQAIFDNDRKTIPLHREDYEAKPQRMLVEQQGVVDTMIKYLGTFENRIR